MKLRNLQYKIDDTSILNYYELAANKPKLLMLHGAHEQMGLGGSCRLFFRLAEANEQVFDDAFRAEALQGVQQRGEADLGIDHIFSV